MVGKGLGISMMAEMMLRGKLNGVKTLPVSPSVSRELGMGLRPGGHLPDGIARLRECVLEFIGGALNMKKAASRQPFYLNLPFFRQDPAQVADRMAGGI